jgi:Mitochondrial inner membrane protein
LNMDDVVATLPAPPQKTKPLRNSVLLVLLAFVVGGAAMAWVFTNWNVARDMLPKEPAPPVVVQAQPAPQAVIAAPPPAAPVTDMTQRIVDLEARLARIDQSASSASDNARRAEGLLLAFSARRAIDRGMALGYVEGQLNAHFGATQPRAVSMIIAASREPVTLDQLQAGLEMLSAQLLAGGPNQGWWAKTQAALGSLFVLRQSGAPSPVPIDRLARAKQFIDIGRVDSALAEVSRLPGRDKAADWMAQARRYLEANRALDLLEAAAIMSGVEPVTVAEPTPAVPQVAPPTAVDETIL